jgi:hypothetical protein
MSWEIEKAHKVTVRMLPRVGVVGMSILFNAGAVVWSNEMEFI